jgi:hypothetical protein
LAHGFTAEQMVELAGSPPRRRLRLCWGAVPSARVVKRQRSHVFPEEFAPRPIGTVDHFKNDGACAEAGNNTYFGLLTVETGSEGFQPFFVQLQHRCLKPF